METMANDTKRVLAEMLTENTGRHMLDSGGAQGRMWQRNQGKDFEGAPASLLSIDEYGIEVTHDVYHWLADRLDFSPEYQGLWGRFQAEEDSDGDRGWMDLMDAFPGWLVENGHCEETGGIYGEGDSFCHNTYNEESLLSQVLQFQYIQTENEELILLQIHGGADVRGGYTDPVAFTANGYGELAMFEGARGSLWCTDCNATWYSDDGWNWYCDGGGADDKESLTEGRGKCPCCKSGTLEAGA